MELASVGATGQEFELTFAERFLIAGRALWFYAGKLAWPTEQAFIYERWVIDATCFRQWLFPAAALVVSALLYRARSRLGRGPLAAVLLFAGTLFPALGFFDVYPFRYSFVADHFQYLASVPLLALGAASLRDASARVGRLGGRACAVLAAVLLVVLAITTVRRAEHFVNSLALWSDVVAKDPDSPLGNEHLGNALRDLGRHEEALAQFDRAVALNPEHAETRNDRGVLLVRMQRYDEALDDYGRAIELDPELGLAYLNRGSLLQALGQSFLAEKDFAMVRRLAGVEP
jgi:tetratricopeptide (TPR) repeat protein